MLLPSGRAGRAYRWSIIGGMKNVSKQQNGGGCVNGCAACAWMGVPYPQQVARMERQLAELFEGLVDEGALLPFLAMDEPWHFRNKVVSPFAPGRGKRERGQILTGMYVPGSHRLVNIDGCPVENAAANAVVPAVKQIMQRYKMEPYNEDTGEGFVRHVLVRVGHNSGEMLVCLVTNGEAFPGAKNFCKELRRRCPGVTTVVQDVNTRATNVILGGRQKVLFGPGFILDDLCGLRFRVSAHSFYQVNAVQTERLYEAAVGAAGLGGAEVVLDAYCGTGTIGLVAASRAAGARVIGVDSVASSIADAKNNARHNGIKNAEFVCEDAGAFMTRLAAANQAVDVLFMDPPRAGASEEFLQAAAQLAPQRIVYISCNPKTQVRDVRKLKEAGYQVASLQGVDMFAHTPHIESICVLVRA